MKENNSILISLEEYRGIIEDNLKTSIRNKELELKLELKKREVKELEDKVNKMMDRLNEIERDYKVIKHKYMNKQIELINIRK